MNKTKHLSSEGSESFKETDTSAFKTRKDLSEVKEKETSKFAKRGSESQNFISSLPFLFQK